MLMPVMRPEVRRGPWRARSLVPAGHVFVDKPFARAPLTWRQNGFVGVMTLGYLMLLQATTARPGDSPFAVFMLAWLMAVATLGIGCLALRIARSLTAGVAALLGRAGSG